MPSSLEAKDLIHKWGVKMKFTVLEIRYTGIDEEEFEGMLNIDGFKETQDV